MRFFIRNILLILLIQIAAPLCAQVSFVIKVPYTEIGKSDILQVEYDVSNANAIGDFSPPIFNGWNIVSGPEYSQQSVTINNQTQNSTSYIYILSPQHTGNIDVPGTSIVADGKKLSCKNITVHVDAKANIIPATPQQNAMQLPPLFDDLSSDDDPFAQNPVLKKGENPEEKIHGNIFIKVSASKTSCFVGEPVLVTYELYSAIQSESKINSQPTFSGCSVIEMTDVNTPATLQKLDGKTYRVFLIRKVQLIPLQDGELKLDTASVDNDVTFSVPDDPYQTKNYSCTIASKPQIITVKPLPEKNKPADFSGVVGQFHITANADSAMVPQGENNNLKIVIEGHGNVGAVTAPSVQWPQGLEAFDRTDSQHIDKTVFPLSGDKTFEIPFIGTQEGTFIIPKISFTYFDPSTETYQTVNTDSIKIIVTHALPKTDAFKNIVTEDITNRKYLWLVPAIALTVALVWLVGAKRKKKNTEENKSEEKINTAENEQTGSETAFAVLKPKTNFAQELHLLSGVTDNQEFFTHTKAILTLALQEKLNTAENADAAILSALKQQTGDTQLLAEAENIFRESNLSLYSPIVSDDKRIILFGQLKLVIERLGV